MIMPLFIGHHLNPLAVEYLLHGGAACLAVLLMLFHDPLGYNYANDHPPVFQNDLISVHFRAVLGMSTQDLRVCCCVGGACCCCRCRCLSLRRILTDAEASSSSSIFQRNIAKYPQARPDSVIHTNCQSSLECYGAPCHAWALGGCRSLVRRIHHLSWLSVGSSYRYPGTRARVPWLH